MSQVNVQILNGDKKVIKEYIVKRLTVGSNARRLGMVANIIDLDCSEQKKGHLLTCAALASTLHDKKGKLIYPEPEGNKEDIGAQSVFDEMDIEEYDALCKAYLEINPLEPTLSSKKKKS